MRLSPLFVANWKMNMRASETREFFKNFGGLFKQQASGFSDTVIAPPFTSLQAAADAAKQFSAGLQLAAQNVHWDESGAHTGEISASMLKDYSVRYAIVGHSERRQFYGETDEAVSKRAQAAVRADIIPIVCVGESLIDFEANKSWEVVSAQLTRSLENVKPASAENLVVAYEPVWAIGTGKAATPEIASDMHEKIRTHLVKIFGASGEKIHILYGGSTSPSNISSLVAKPNVDGALVGGASLKPESFWALIEAGREAARN